MVRAAGRRTIQQGEVTLAGPDALVAFAHAFAQTLRPGDTVALVGALGAGKTTFVRGLAAGLGSRDDVSSPTFVFRQRYGGPVPIEHLDLYRIEDASELSELGLDEAFGEETVTLVEWADLFPQLLPPGTIHVRIDGAGDEPRRVVVTP